MPTVEPGEKFGCLAFRLFTLQHPLPGEMDLGYGCWALPGPPVPIDARWRSWLGELETEQIGKANVVLFAKMPSLAPATLDDENSVLLARVEYLLWGIIIAAGIPGYDHAVSFSGVNRGAGPEVRSVGHPQEIFSTVGIPAATVTLGHIAESCNIITRLEEMQQERMLAGLYKRLMRGFNAFIVGLRAEPPDVRLHQFVRAVESFLPSDAWGQYEFVRHVKDFVTDVPDPTDLLRELYQLRNVAEHHGDLDRGLPNVPHGQRPQVADRRVRQAEGLIRALYRRLFAARSGYLHFFRDDTSISRFWADPEWVRRALWGPPFDIHAVL